MKSVPLMILLVAFALAWFENLANGQAPDGQAPSGQTQERRQDLVATMVRPVHPLLIRNEHSPLLRVMIDVAQGQKALLTSMEISLDGTDDLNDIEAIELFGTGNQEAFSKATKIGTARSADRAMTLAVDRPLTEGRNVFWLSCRLKDSAALEHGVSATCMKIATSLGNLEPREDFANAKQRIGVALRRPQDDGVHTYRIPALTTSSKGTLLAVYDMRRRAGRDLQEDIDIGLSRSTDGGRTWDSPRVIMDMGTYGGLPQEQNGCSDPGIIVDQQTGEIFCFALWMNGKPGHHQWVDDGSEPGFEIGKSAQFMMVRSTDDGLTWSPPENLTRRLKQESWWLLAPAPQSGICLPNGTLVMPIQGRTGRAPLETFATIMTSSDHGRSWTVGKPGYSGGNECQAALLGDDSIMLNIRNDHERFRAVVVTNDLGNTWQPHSTSRTTIIEPNCNGSLLRFDYVRDDRQQHVLLFANPHSQKGRTHHTLQVSFDDGLTWPDSHHWLLDEGKGAGYPSLTRVDRDHVGIVYEGSQAHLVYEKLPIIDLLEPTRRHASRDVWQRDVSKEGIQYLAQRRQSPPFGEQGFDLAGLRSGMGARQEPTVPGVKLTKVKVGDISCEWVVTPEADEDVRLLYLHGGGWVSGSGGNYLPLAAEISRSAKCAVLLPDYRLAPEHPFPAGLDDCVAAHDWLVVNGPYGSGAAKATFIAGDSAGGNLTLATLLALKERHRPLPSGAIAISPGTDFTLTSQSLKSVYDPIISSQTMPEFRSRYLVTTDHSHPLASPVFGDYRGLPPLLIQTGEHEMLRDDSIRVAKKARADGTPVTLEIWPGMVHVFQIRGLPESREAIGRIGDFVRSKLVAVSKLGGDRVVAQQQPAPAWEMTKTVSVGDLEISISKPRLVARSHRYLWFPTMTRLSGGELFANFSTNLDAIVADRTSSVSWSADDGLSWSEPSSIMPKGDLYAETMMRLKNGDEIMLPFNLFPDGDAMRGWHQIVFGNKGQRKVTFTDKSLTVSKWPRPDGSFSEKLGLSGFGFNGNGLMSKSGEYLATMYGYFKNERRYSLVMVESTDGLDWKFRSMIAGFDCPLAGGEGPCESQTIRLGDGRLMNVFRLASNVPYGQTFSEDDGRTWSAPTAMKDAHSVQPSLAMMKDGSVVLTGGRPGIFAWINRAGDGKDWLQVDLQSHHNESHPKDAIARADQTTSYTEVVALDDQSVIVIYDRVPNGWKAIPQESPDTNSIWVVKLAWKAGT